MSGCRTYALTWLLLTVGCSGFRVHHDATSVGDSSYPPSDSAPDVARRDGPLITDGPRDDGPRDAAKADGPPLDAAKLDGPPLDAARLDGPPLDATRLDGGVISDLSLPLDGGITGPWARSLSGYPLTVVSARAVAMDANNNVFVTGYFVATLTVDGQTINSAALNNAYNVFVAKFLPTGKLAWLTSGGGADPSIGQAIALDSKGNVYVGGIFQTTATFGNATLVGSAGDNGFVAKLSANGQFLWAVACGSKEADDLSSLVVDGNDDIIVGGSFGGNLFREGTFGSHKLISDGGADGFVAKLSAQGVFAWAVAARGTSSERLNSVAVDGSGAIYACGFTLSPTLTVGTKSQTALTNNFYTFATKLNPQGAASWLKLFGGTDSSYPCNIAATPTNQVYLAASFEGSLQLAGATLTSQGFDDVYVTHLDSSNGTPLWARSFGGPDDDIVNGIAVGGSDIYLSGTFQDKLVAGQIYLGASKDQFIVHLSSSGGLGPAVVAGGITDDNGYGIAARGTEGVFVGDFRSQVTFGKVVLDSKNRAASVWRLTLPH